MGGVDVWFESSDLSLGESGEAVASAFLIPALAAGRRLELTTPVCPVWNANMPALLNLVGRWWDYSPMLPSCDTRAVASAPVVARPSALCFSGGVDSFFSLLRGPQPEYLVAVHGFDVPLAETERMAAVQASVGAVAAGFGTRAAIVRTNLRTHPAFGAAPWERTHGGGLAAIGHLLGDEIGTLVISSSCAYSNSVPWGSHWLLDPLWASERLAVVHFGATHRRGAKLREISGEPIVQNHLRVCWENRALALNCSRCEKCVRTEVILAGCGQLDRFTVFGPAATLADRVDAIERIPSATLRDPYEEALRAGLDRKTDRAVRLLLKRTRRSALAERYGAPVRRVRALLRGALAEARTPNEAGP